MTNKHLGYDVLFLIVATLVFIPTNSSDSYQTQQHIGSQNVICRHGSASCKETEENHTVPTSSPRTKKSSNIEGEEDLRSKSESGPTTTRFIGYVFFVWLALVVLMSCAVAYKFYRTRRQDYELSRSRRPLSTMISLVNVPLIAYEKI